MNMGRLKVSNDNDMDTEKRNFQGQGEETHLKYWPMIVGMTRETTVSLNKPKL